MSDTRLIIEDEHAGASDHLVGHEGRFIGGCRRRQEAGADPSVDGRAILVGFNKVGVAIILHQAGDAVERLVPRDALPLLLPGSRLRIFRPRLGLDEVEQRALRAQRAAVGGMIESPSM